MKKITLLVLLLTPFMVFAQNSKGQNQPMNMDSNSPMKKGQRGSMKKGDGRSFPHPPMMHPMMMASSINVVGHSSVNVEPDIAYVTIGANKQGATALEAQQSVNKIMENIQSVLSGMKIAKKDIQTTEYSIRGHYEYKDGASTLKGYDARQTLRVMVSLSSLNNLLDSVTKADSNMISDIQFDVKNKGESYQKAMTQAIDNAREKALKIANQLGVKLGRVKDVREMGAMPSPISPMARGMMMTSDMSSPSMVNPGQVGQSATVFVKFDIIPPRPLSKEDK